MEVYLQDLDLHTVVEDFISHHPFNMSNFQFAFACIECYWYMIKDNDVRSTEIDDLLTTIGSQHPSAWSDTIKHEILPKFLPWISRNRFAKVKKSSKPPPVHSASDLGRIVGEVCRHCIMHGRDKANCKLVNKSLNVSAYTRDELAEVLRNVFANYFGAAYRHLASKQKLNMLRLEDINPIPSIFLAPSSGQLSVKDDKKN